MQLNRVRVSVQNINVNPVAFGFRMHNIRFGLVQNACI